MAIYVITEIFQSKVTGAYTTTNNHVKDEEYALDLFEMRSNMLMQSINTKRVLKQQYNPKECWGITKVELENGCTVEIAISKLELV